MKNIFKTIALLLLLTGCRETHKHYGDGKSTYHVESVGFSHYKGKVVQYIETDSYVTSQHDIVIHFTDGTDLTIVANKYVLDVYK